MFSGHELDNVKSSVFRAANGKIAPGVWAGRSRQDAAEVFFKVLRRD